MKLSRIGIYNPFFIIDAQNREYQIKTITFYNKNGVIAQTTRGWFGDSNNPFDDLEVGDLKKKNKVDFNQKANFYTKAEPDIYGKNQKYAHLYLYVDGEYIKTVGESTQVTERDTQIEYKTISSFKINNTEVEVVKYHFEKNEFGKLIEQVASELKKQGVDISNYDLTQLLTHYKLVKKEA